MKEPSLPINGISLYYAIHRTFTNFFLSVFEPVSRAGKKFKSMKELLASSRDSSPVRERAFSAVKSLVLREKEDKFTAEFGGDEKVLSLLNSLLDAGKYVVWQLLKRILPEN